MISKPGTSASIPIPPRPATEVAAGLELTADARAMLRPDLDAGAYFDILIKAGLYRDAVAVVSRMLTPKQAVWLGCLCLWTAGAPAPGSAAEAAVRACVIWLRTSTEEARRAAQRAGDAATPRTPAGLLATAAFLAEGSMAPPGAPEVLPKPHFAGLMVQQAVLLLAASPATPDEAQFLRTALALAVEVYRGKNTYGGIA